MSKGRERNEDGAMHAYDSAPSERQSLAARERGAALIVTLLIMMLISALMVGFVAAVVADQRAAGLDRDQTQAYAAAHAGMEKLTSDLNGLFTSDFSPNGTQLNNLRTNPPVIPGFSFIAPGGGSNSGYMVAARLVDANGVPQPENPTEGSEIKAGAYQGLKGIITPYDITITARSTGLGGAEVRMRRSLQTVAIPVFQFGMFSETDLAFHAGAEAFVFGGRVHTNGNLFLAAADGGTLTITDRITAVGEVIRKKLPNGLDTSSSYEGAVRIPTTIASNPASNVYRNLGVDEGSLTGTIPKTISPNNTNGVWFNLSTATYKTNIRNGTTGAKRLDLPLVADLDSNGVPDAQPIELIRRPPQGPPYENLTTPIVYTQRFFAQASLRILLSDSNAEITSLPTVTAGSPVSLAYGSAYTTGAGTGLLPPLAGSGGSGATGSLPANVYKSSANQSLINGVIKIELQKNDGTWLDVTNDILARGITGRNLADKGISTPGNRWNTVPSTTANTCAEINPDAIIRVQRVRDVPNSANTTYLPCGVNSGNTATSPTASDYWPNVLYDTREGQTRDLNLSSYPNTPMSMAGVMHYVELDVSNLKKWLAGTIGTQGTQAKNDNGYIIYFSDRRNNKNAAGKETGEFGYEDVVNLTNTLGTPNAPTLDTGEDLNGNGVLDDYGKTPVNLPTGAAAPYDSSATPLGTTITGTNAAVIARANRPIFFRRALKVVNGGLGNLPQGLTIVSENPVYLQGDYNANAANSAWETTNVPAALIADAVTLLSNAWSDVRSFVSPNDSQDRDAKTTKYRLAIITGKGIPFPKPSSADSSFGSDGGAHNFMRSLEDWEPGGTVDHRYRGSLVSFFINRQGVGTFKCCQKNAYNRGERDWSFDTDFSNPTKLPPGTPMFRDVNTLTFRQLLRPTQ